MFTFFGRRSLSSRRSRNRFFRPLVEGLESRELLAFDLTISPAATNAAVTTTFNAGTSTTTYTSNSGGANVSINAINTELAAGRNVVVTTGGAPLTETGRIFTSGITEFQFSNSDGTSLTLRNGSTGALASLAGITIAGLQLTKQGTLILDANQNVSLSGQIQAGTITITAGTGNIFMPSGGELGATVLNLTAGGDIGANGQRILTNVSQLNTNTNVDNPNTTSQFITEASGLSALNLNAGNSQILLTVTLGAVSDADPQTDVVASTINLNLVDATKRDVGSSSNPIATNVDGLLVNTFLGGGDQFLTEANGLTNINITTGEPSLGNIVLNVQQGTVTDPDESIDIRAAAATINLNDAAARDFGASDIPIGTKVDSLSVNTSTGGGNQFITEDNDLTGLNLDAGTGDVNLTLTAGALADNEFGADITADIATILINATTLKNVGSSVNPIQTAVNGLTVTTAAGNGSQFLEESNGLTALNLRAGTGDVTLTAKSGSVSDIDSTLDIVARAATVTLSDSSAKDLGSAANPIRTSVDSLTTDTEEGGSQFITETDGLTALQLIVGGFGSGSITLTLEAGGVADIDTIADGFNDITCPGVATISLNDVTPQSFGTADHPIDTKVRDGLTVSTFAGGGNQFLSEINALGGLNLNAGAGNVTLTLLGGFIVDNDSVVDVSAATATITLLNQIASTSSDFGTAAKPIQTDVSNLSVNTAAANGDQFIIETNSTTVTSLDAGSGSITLTGGTFNLAAAGNAFSDMSTLVVQSPAIVNLAAVIETIGGLAGTGTVAFKQNSGLNVGLNNQSTEFFGGLTGNFPTDFIEKFGTGTLTFSGDHTFTGAYIVAGGKLLVNGTIAASTALMNTADSSGLIGGTGTINRLISVFNGGHVAPGASAGVLKTGELSFNGGSSFDVEITSVGQFDQANVTGKVSIGSTAVLNLVPLGTLNLQGGDELIIIQNDGNGATGDAIQGTFKDLPQNAKLSANFLGSGHAARISYVGGDGNDVSIKVSPGAPFPWHNFTPGKSNDVGGGLDIQPDGKIAADDVVKIINYINARGAGEIPEDAAVGLPFGFLDTNQDNSVAADDVVQVINFINAHPGAGEAEAESAIAEEISAQVDPPSGLGSSILATDLLNMLAEDLAAQRTRRRQG